MEGLINLAKQLERDTDMPTNVAYNKMKNQLLKVKRKII
jgi:hypothetical protein